MLGFGPISDAPLAALSGAVITYSKTHLTRSLIRLTASKQHNASSYLKASIAKAHQARSVITAGLTDTHQAISVLRAGLTDSHQARALLKAGVTDAHQARALLKAGVTDTHQARSVLRAGFTDSHQARALLKAGFTDSHQARALLKAGLTDTHQARALLKVGLTDSHQARALLKAGLTDAHLTNSLFKAGLTDAHQARALLKVGLTDAHQARSVLRAGLSDTHQARSVLRAGLSDAHLTNSLFKAGLTDTHQARSVLRAGLSDTHQARALLKAGFTDTHQARALLKAGFTDTHQARALLKAGVSESHNANARLKAGTSKSHSTTSSPLNQGHIFYNDNFDGPITGNLLTFGGTWSQSNGVLQQTSTSAGDPKKVYYNGNTRGGNAVDIRAKVRVDTWVNGDYARAGLSLRTDSATGYGYNILFHNNTNTIEFLDDQVAWRNSYTYNWSVGVWYWFRAYMEGYVMYAKVWPDGTAEPANFPYVQDFSANIRNGGYAAINGGSSGTDGLGVTSYSAVSFDNLTISYPVSFTTGLRSHNHIAVLRKLLSKSHNTNSLFRATTVDFHQVRSLLKAGLTKSHQTRALLRAGLIESHNTNSLLRTAFSKSHQTRSSFRAGLNKAHVARASLKAVLFKTHNTNALIRARFTDTHNTNALLRASASLKTHNTNALIRGAASLETHNTNALIRASNTFKSHVVYGNKLALSRVTVSSGGYLKKTGTTKKLAMLIGIGDGPPLSGLSTIYDQSLLVLYSDGSNGFVSTPFRTMRNPSGNLLPGRKEVYYDTQFGQWIAIANDFSSNRVYTSNNGVDWIKTSAGRTVGSTIVVSSAINGLSYGNGITVFAVQGDYAGTTAILSYNGTSWTTTWPSALESGVFGTNIANIAFLNGKFLAYTNANLMATSTDNVTWTSVTSPFTGVRNLGGQAMYGLATDGSYFYAIGTDNASHYDSVYKSSDGTSWSLVNSSIGLSYLSSYYSTSLTYFNGYFRTSVFGLGGYYSSDLINWTSEGSYVPIAYDYYSNTVVASDGGYAPGFGYKQIGTLYKASSYAGTWTALSAVSGVDGIGLGAAGYYGADTLYMITSMLKKITFSKSHNANTLLRKTFLDPHNTGSYFKAGQNKAHQIRTQLKVDFSKTHYTNVLLRASFSKTHYTNILLRASLSKTHNTIAQLYSSDTFRTHRTNALLKTTLSQIHNANALLRQAVSERHNANGLLKAGLTRLHNLNALLKAAVRKSHDTNAVLTVAFRKSIISRSLLRSTSPINISTDALLKSSRLVSQSVRTVNRAIFKVSHNSVTDKRATSSKDHTASGLLRIQRSKSHFTDQLLRATYLESVNAVSLLKSHLIKSQRADSLLRIEQYNSHLTSGLVRKTGSLLHTAQTLTQPSPLRNHNTGLRNIITFIKTHDTRGLVRSSYDLSQVLGSRFAASPRTGHTTFSRMYGFNAYRDHNFDSVLRDTSSVSHSSFSVLGVKSNVPVHYATALLIRYNEAVVRNTFPKLTTQSSGKFIPFVKDVQKPRARNNTRILLKKNGWGRLDIAAKETSLNNHQIDYKTTCSNVDIIVPVGEEVSPNIRAIWGACLDNINSATAGDFVAQDLSAPGVAPQFAEPEVVAPPKPKQIFGNIDISPITIKRAPAIKEPEPAPVVIQRVLQDAPAAPMVAMAPQGIKFDNVVKKAPPPKIWKNTERLLKMPR